MTATMKTKVWRACAGDCDDEAMPAPYCLTYWRCLRLAMGGDCDDKNQGLARLRR